MIFVAGTFLLNSCELNTLKLSCDNCYDIKPTEGILAIDLSLLRYDDSIPIVVYKGKLESGSVFLRDTLTKNYLDLWVPVDQFYTVVAEYHVNETTIKAVDGDMVSVYEDDSNCSVACWRARDGKVDCRLR